MKHSSIVVRAQWDSEAKVLVASDAGTKSRHTADETLKQAVLPKAFCGTNYGVSTRFASFMSHSATAP